MGPGADGAVFPLGVTRDIRKEAAKTHEIIISGFGGQGVMAIGKTMVEAGMEEGLFVSWLPSYGPEMRGGTANCSVVLSDQPSGSAGGAQSKRADAMNKPSLLKFEKEVLPGGIILINSSIVELKAQRSDVSAYYVPCIEIANDLGNPKVANMAMLGAYLEASGRASARNGAQNAGAYLPWPQGRTD